MARLELRYWLSLLTVFVVPTVYTLFARRKVPGEIMTPEMAQAVAD